jgi:heat shock protein HtpX
MLNQIKTALLLGGLAGLFLLIGYLLGGPGGLLIGLIFAIIINFVSYWFSDKIALRIYGAIPLDKSAHEIHDMTQDLCRRMNLPKPKLYVIPAQYSNAFATGRSPKHASVAMTEGIINLLSKEELKGVIAHELAHIKNRDILISSVAATIAAVISYVAFMARWAAIFGGFGDRDRGGGILELIVLAIVAPLMATIIQLAISRSREYLADETGARAMRSGHSLADALHKLHNQTYKLKPTGTTEATAHMFIVNPFSAKGFVAMFSTHPDADERIKRLRSFRF